MEGNTNWVERSGKDDMRQGMRSGTHTQKDNAKQSRRKFDFEILINRIMLLCSHYVMYKVKGFDKLWHGQWNFLYR